MYITFVMKLKKLNSKNFNMARKFATDSQIKFLQWVSKHVELPLHIQVTVDNVCDGKGYAIPNSRPGMRQVVLNQLRDDYLEEYKKHIRL